MHDVMHYIWKDDSFTVKQVELGGNHLGVRGQKKR